MKWVRRVVAPILIGFFAMLLYAIVNRFGYNITSIKLNEFYGEQFFSVISTLYAIITALILVKGIESFDALGGAVNSEAVKLKSINAYLFYLNNPNQKDKNDVIKNIRELLLSYAANVLEQRTALKSEKNDTIIDQCMRHSLNISTVDQSGSIAIRELMIGLDKLRELRSDRVNLSHAKVPGYLIGMLAAMTVSIMVPFFLHHEVGISFNYYIIFVLGTFGSFIFFLLMDINRPYTGLWKINLEPFQEAESEIRAAVE